MAQLGATDIVNGAYSGRDFRNQSEHRKQKVKRKTSQTHHNLKYAPEPRSRLLPFIPPEFSHNNLIGWGLFLIKEQSEEHHEFRWKPWEGTEQGWL